MADDTQSVSFNILHHLRVKSLVEESIQEPLRSIRTILMSKSFKTEYIALNVPEPLRLDSREAVEKHFRETHKENIIKQVENYTKQKESLQKRIDLINQLKQSQKGPVRIMDQISKDLPDLVWLDRLNMSGGVITIEGRGLNPNAIANFVENVKSDAFFEEPDLSSVTGLTASSTTPVYSFQMSFKFTYAPKGEAGAAGAATTTGTTGTAGTATTSATGGK